MYIYKYIISLSRVHEKFIFHYSPKNFYKSILSKIYRPKIKQFLKLIFITFQNTKESSSRKRFRVRVFQNELTCLKRSRSDDKHRGSFTIDCALRLKARSIKRGHTRKCWTNILVSEIWPMAGERVLNASKRWWGHLQKNSRVERNVQETDDSA